MGSIKVIELLKGVDLFSSLSEEQLDTLARLVIPQTFSKDETIILEDDESVQALFLIAEGEVKVYMTGMDKRETILTLLTKGDFFGEMSLIDGEPRSASVKSVTPAEVLIIRREHFIQQIKQTPDLAMSLLVEMSKRLRKANRQIGSLAMLTVYGRIAGTILNLVEERGVRIHGENGKMVTVIRNRPTQKQLAEMSGTTRETVSRVLSQLQKKGSISLAGKDLILLEEDALKPEESKDDEQNFDDED
ncbi:MAG TPA: Crp/Fnr family transcriptional regulator [Fibrobacteraceae bacterium]|nr:Crp/Fnr family transcriptional regulator [Fibrobacteraceae bacterium]